MKVFIAYGHEGHPVSIVLAKSLREARVYWQGKGVTPFAEKSSDDFSLDDPGVLVVPLLETRIENNRPIDRGGMRVVVVPR